MNSVCTFLNTYSTYYAVCTYSTYAHLKIEKSLHFQMLNIYLIVRNQSGIFTVEFLRILKYQISDYLVTMPFWPKFQGKMIAFGKLSEMTMNLPNKRFFSLSILGKVKICDTWMRSQNDNCSKATFKTVLDNLECILGQNVLGRLRINWWWRSLQFLTHFSLYLTSPLKNLHTVLMLIL